MTSYQPLSLAKKSLYMSLFLGSGLVTLSVIIFINLCVSVCLYILVSGDNTLQWRE